MKKTIVIIMATITVFLLAFTIFAETTTLTTTVPPAEYTMTIPKDQEIAFNSTREDIGFVVVTAISGFAEGKGVSVTESHTPFSCSEVSTTIPYKTRYLSSTSVDSALNVSTVESMLFRTNGGKVLYATDSKGKIFDTTPPSKPYLSYEIEVVLSSADWGKALPGEYTSTMTFAAEVVSIEE